MITKLTWTCPDGLIEQALKECPVTGEGTVLNEPTGDFFYDSWKIKDHYKDTPWKQVLDTLPVTIGQARIIKLEHGDTYQAHADIDNRWHLNLTGEQSYLIDLDKKVMHECVRDNCWAYMDASRRHVASNFGARTRLQLVVREPLRRSSQPVDLVSIMIGPAYEQSQFRYKFDNLVSPFLNHADKNYKLADFAHTTFNLTFKLERELLDELKQLLTADYKLTIL
jgi:Aspartyl/Asparaginyl beta-hydroxylase